MKKTDSIISALKESLTPIKDNKPPIFIDDSELKEKRLLTLRELSKLKSKKIYQLTEENARLRELLNESLEVVSSLNEGYNQDIKADIYMDSAKQLLNKLTEQNNEK